MVAVVVMCAPAAAADPRAELARAADEYRAHLLRERPDLATRARLRGAEARLEPVTEATIPAADAWLAAFDARLAALDRGGLGAEDGARLDTLRARVARERAPYLAGAWRSDPAAYLELGPQAVLEAAAAARANPCKRVRFATGRLRALPEVLRAARINLERSPADADAATPWLAAMDSLRALPARLAACREPAREADLVAADSLALAALGRFVRFLREERGAVPGGPGR